MNDDVNAVYLAWQDAETRSWHVVGLLTSDANGYVFRYTKGAQKSPRFVSFSGMNDLTKKYISKRMFPLFSNRILSPNRPEYPNFIKWLGLPSDAGPIEILGRSGGTRETDKLEMFSKIKPNNDNSFEHIFFCHGLRHLSESATKRLLKLRKGEDLLLCLDSQNGFDKNAVIIRAADPAEILGYIPRYLANAISTLIKKEMDSVRVTVEALSNDAPANYKLMCKLVIKPSKELSNEFMGSDEFQPIHDNITAEC